MLRKIIDGAVVLLAVGIIAFLSFGGGKTLGDQVQNDVFWFTNGAAFGSNHVLINQLHLDMRSGQNQVSWLNNTPNPVKILGTNAFVTLAKNNAGVTLASSTLAVTAGTSTTATVTNSATPLYGSIMDGVLIATSTPQISLNGIVNSALVGTHEQGVVRVPVGQYVVFALENPYNQACTGVTCETATSTNRGYNLGIDFQTVAVSSQ